MKTTLYPGSFDPITYGHMDVISQALKVYDKVIIAILVNSNKGKGMFSFKERTEIIQKIYENIANVEVIAIEDNTAVVDVALKNNCNTMYKLIYRNFNIMSSINNFCFLYRYCSSNNKHT